MPNRIIKDSIHTSETVDKMTDFQFRVWVNLITYVDDYGRGDARPEVIKGFCFPLREKVTIKIISETLSELASLGCIKFYKVNGRSYLYFPNWESHQTVRNHKSKFPAPSEADAEDCQQLNSIEINCTQVNANVPVIQSNPNPNPNPNPNSLTRTRKRFTPPTVEEVRAYCQERGNNVDPQKFVDYYESVGWMVGNKPMKDFKACVRTWERNDFSGGKRDSPKESGVGYGEVLRQREYDDDYFASLEVDLTK